MSLKGRSACRPCGEHINNTNTKCISDKSSICGDEALFSIHTTKTMTSGGGPGRLAFLPYYNEGDLFPSHYTLFNLPVGIFNRMNLPPEMYLFHLSNPEGSFSRLESLAEKLAFGKLKNAYPQTPQIESRFAWEIHDNYEDTVILDETRISIHPSFEKDTGCCSLGNTHTAINSKGVLWLASYNSEETECDEPSDNSEETECDESYVIKYGGLDDVTSLNRVMWSLDSKEALFLTLERYKMTKIEFEQRPILISPYSLGPLSLPNIATDRDFTNTEMPRQYAIVGGRVPFYNDSMCRGYLLAYLNKSNGANYAIKDKFERTFQWEYVMKLCKTFCDNIELDRSSENSKWGFELGMVNRSREVFSSFYIGLLGNEKEVWVVAFIGGNTMKKVNQVNLNVFDPITLTKLPKQIIGKDLVVMKFQNRKVPVENACELPLFRDCLSSPQHGVYTGPTSFCAGSASNSFHSNCIGLLTKSDKENDNFTENYCAINRESVECKCFNRMDNEMFRYMTRKFGDKLVVHDSCWWKPCLVRDRGMLMHSTDDKKCESEVKFNIIWLEDAENIDLSGLTQISLGTPPGGNKTAVDETIGVMKTVRDSWMLILSVICILMILVASPWYKHSSGE